MTNPIVSVDYAKRAIIAAFMVSNTWKKQQQDLLFEGIRKLLVAAQISEDDVEDIVDVQTNYVGDWESDPSIHPYNNLDAAEDFVYFMMHSGVVLLDPTDNKFWANLVEQVSKKVGLTMDEMQVKMVDRFIVDMKDEVNQQATA